MANVITWFEIPTRDLERACKFYGTLFGIKLEPVLAGDRKLAMFPAAWDKGEIGGALIAGPGAKPSPDGAMIYLNAGEDLSKVLGKVLVPKTKIPMDGAGFMAFFEDTEGNHVGLSSPK